MLQRRLKVAAACSQLPTPLWNTISPSPPKQCCSKIEHQAVTTRTLICPNKIEPEEGGGQQQQQQQLRRVVVI